MRLPRTIATILLTGAAFGQGGSTSATFVAADVHATPKEEFAFSFQNLAPGNRVILRGLTLAHMIALAYGVDDDKISGGPKWLDMDKFDVIAKPPRTTAKKPELQAMLQALIAQRFQLKVRKEDKPFPVYVWTPAKTGMHLTPSKSETEGDCQAQPGDGFLVRNCTGMTIEELGRQLRLFANGYFNREVLDRTGAKGRYDFALKWSGRGQIGHSPDAISLYDVLEKQYGIKTGEDTVPEPAIVVESANETPAPNPPDTEAALPPLPKEFEVASIKVDKDPQPQGNFRFVGGRLDLRAIPMRDLIEVAYGLDDDNMVVGAPSWVEHEVYDVVAKTDPSVDFVGMQPMIRKLLDDRFHLKAHRESRPLEVYSLKVGKNGPKLTPGDSAQRGDCKRSFDRGAFLLTCVNTTMAEFADTMRRYAAGYIDLPVADLTGLKDAFNFTMTWNSRGVTDPGRGKTEDSSGAPVAPGGGVTFFAGVEKIGLKMTREKRPMPVLVVDSIDREPAEN
jgi:uncharacterized protein (TIGR03435 family)